MEVALQSSPIETKTTQNAKSVGCTKGICECKVQREIDFFSEVAASNWCFFHAVCHTRRHKHLFEAFGMAC